MKFLIQMIKTTLSCTIDTNVTVIIYIQMSDYMNRGAINLGKDKRENQNEKDTWKYF